MPELAARNAAQLPGASRIVLVVDAMPGSPEAAFRRKLAALGPLLDDVRVATWALAAAIDAADPAALLTQTVPACRAEVGDSAGVRRKGPLRAPALSLRDWAAKRVATFLMSVAGTITEVLCRRRGCPRLGEPSSNYLYKLDRVDEIRSEAEALGCQLAIIGGAGIDVAAGGVVRERKDIDLILTGGPVNALERLTNQLAARGYQIRLRIAGSQVKLLHGGHRLEVFRPTSDSEGGLHFLSRYRYCRLGPDAIVTGVLSGRNWPVLRAEYLYLMKREMTRDLTSFRFRSFSKRTNNDRADLAAIGAIADRGLVRALEATGIFQTTAIGLPRIPLLSRRSRRTDPLAGWLAASLSTPLGVASFPRSR